MPTYCNFCSKVVGIKPNAILCDLCDNWTHLKCNNLNKKSCKIIQKSPDPWFCIKCIQENVPYSNLNDTEFDLLTEKGMNNYLCLSKEAQNNVRSTTFENLNKIPNPTDINTCKYYDIETLNSLNINSNPINNILHLNIGSLQLHFGELEILLNSINFNFGIMGITETLLRSNENAKTNINIEGFNIEHTPTNSSKGGALLYLHESLKYNSRNDLNILKNKELESVFVEISNKNKNNLIVGCIYRHPCMDQSEFIIDYMTPLLQKLSQESKNVLLLGDFNINLLDYNNSSTSDFLDLINSNLFLTCIDKPTRITSRSKTLI